MNYIIVDLEATCWAKKGHSPNEIIEIGAICFNDQKENLGEFDIFVKPKVHPILSDFCTELTSITQEMVDTADPFPIALTKFKDWITSFEDPYLLCSWGFYDKKQFEKDCLLHELPVDWLDAHISLKHQFAKFKKLRRPMGMKGALKIF